VTAAIAPARSEASRPSRGLAGVSLAIGLVFAGPLLYLAYRAVTVGNDASDVIFSSSTAGPLLRTLLLGVTVSAATAVLGTSLAWLTVRTDLPLRGLWRLLVPIPLAIPSFVGAAALIAAFARGGLVDELLGVDRLPRVEGFAAAFLVLTLLTYPFVYLPVAARLSALPASLEEGARMLGRSPASVFRTVVLPQASPAIWAGALLVFLYCLAEFGAVQLLRYDTLTRAIYSARLVPEVSVPLSLLLGLVAVAVVATERRIGRSRLVTDAPRHRAPVVVALHRWRWPSLVFVAGVTLLALGAPIVVLAHWALRGSGASTFLGAGGVHELASAAQNTVVAGTVTAVVATLVVLPVARLVARHPGRWGDVPNALVIAGFALPGVVIALAVVFWTLQLPEGLGLYQSFAVLVFAYVVHFGAQAMRSGQIAVASVPVRVEDAARMLGAGRVRRLATIELPLMLPGLAAGAGLVLLSTLKELPATLLLAPIGFDTLATRTWQASAEGFLAEAGLTALLLIAVSTALTWLLVVRRSGHLL
jgi:iron(III) transport system permease protein